MDQARSTFLGSGGGHALSIDLPEDLPRVMADPGRHRAGPQQPVLERLADTRPSRPRSGSRPRGTACTWRSRYPTGAGACRRTGCRTCSASMSAQQLARGRAGPAAPAWGCRYARGLVEAHGGRIWAESAGAGHGTRFTFTLPVAEDAADAAGPAPRRSRRPREGDERTRILVVDDDPHTLRYVRDTLAEADYAPVVTGDPEALPGLIRTHKPRLVLLDLVLPGHRRHQADGRPARARGPAGHLHLGLRQGRDDRQGAGAGAADYIAKPFSSSELTARVRAALRRRAEPEPFRLGELAIHYEDRRVTVAGRVTLTMTEFEVLRVLSTNAGRAVTYDSLLRQAWGNRERGSAAPKLVRAIVKGLRSKLGDDAAKPAYVCNVRGVGYRMPRPGER